MKAAVSKLPF